jgi:hypothetical protein
MCSFEHYRGQMSENVSLRTLPTGGSPVKALRDILFPGWQPPCRLGLLANMPLKRSLAMATVTIAA